METMSNGIMPVYNMGENGEMFGGNGAIWLLFILFFAFSRNGYGYNQENLMSDEFIKRDIFNTNQNVSNTACQTQRDVIDSRYTTQLGLQNLGQQISDCCCQNGKEIIENRYTTQLGLQNLGQQMSACCCETNRNIDAVRAENYKNTCEITTAIHAEGEATRALINAQAMQELRDKLADRDRELMSANLALQNNAQTQTLINEIKPCPKPAYLSCSPYFSYNNYPGFGCGCGCGNI